MKEKLLQHQTKIIIGHHHPKSQCQQLNSDRLTEGYFNRGRRKKRTHHRNKKKKQQSTTWNEEDRCSTSTKTQHGTNIPDQL